MIFTKNGIRAKFVIKDDDNIETLKNLIRDNGGRIVSERNADTDTIFLVTPDFDDKEGSKEFKENKIVLKSTFVEKCCEAEEFLPFSDFCLNEDNENDELHSEASTIIPNKNDNSETQSDVESLAAEQKVEIEEPLVKKRKLRSHRRLSINNNEGRLISDISEDESDKGENEVKESERSIRERKAIHNLYKQQSSKEDASDVHYRKITIAPKVTRFSKQTTSSGHPYHAYEDEAIIKYIISSGRYDELKGNAFWQNAEEDKICVERTWQSMKERFRKHIVSNLNKYPISELTDKKKTRIENFYFNESDSDCSEGRKNKGVFTIEEDKAILRFIIEKEGFSRTGGITLWQEMEKIKVCSRSWQSMKERFRKRILPNLQKYKVKMPFVKKLVDPLSMSNSQKYKIISQCEKVLTVKK